MPGLNVTTGNTVIAAFTLYTSGRSFGSVTDSQGNTYTLAGTISGGDASHKMAIYYALNVTGSASLAVTANISGGSTGYRSGVAVQYSGIASFDAAATFKVDSSSTAHTTNAVTTTAASDLVIGWFVTWADARTFSQSGSWTHVAVAGDTILVDQVVGAAGSYSPAVTTAGTTQLVSLAAAFKAARRRRVLPCLGHGGRDVDHLWVCGCAAAGFRHSGSGLRCLRADDHAATRDRHGRSRLGHVRGHRNGATSSIRYGGSDIEHVRVDERRSTGGGHSDGGI